MTVICRLERFFNCHAGRRLVLVCNGPSLNQTNFSLIRREICMGMNKIFLGMKKFCFSPRYFIAVNPKVIEQSATEIEGLPCIRFLTDGQKQVVVRKSGLTYLLNTAQPPEDFSFNICNGVREGGTVTYAALQVAYYMGFREVIIVGMDHRYEFTGLPHETVYMHGPDPNHFTPSYFQGHDWDNPDLQRSERFYALARQVYEAGGRRIVDCTVNGACDIFEKATLEDTL